MSDFTGWAYVFFTLSVASGVLCIGAVTTWKVVYVVFLVFTALLIVIRTSWDRGRRGNE